MITVSQARPYGRFIEIKSNVRRERLQFLLEAVLAIEKMQEPQSNLEKKEGAVFSSFKKNSYLISTSPNPTLLACITTLHFSILLT